MNRCPRARGENSDGKIAVSEVPNERITSPRVTLRSAIEAEASSFYRIGKFSVTGNALKLLDRDKEMAEFDTAP